MRATPGGSAVAPGLRSAWRFPCYVFPHAQAPLLIPPGHGGPQSAADACHGRSLRSVGRL
jgi:hypothetical protein